MRKCGHCSAEYDDAQTACPACGIAFDAPQLGTLVKQARDRTPVPLQRFLKRAKPWLIAAVILAIPVLLFRARYCRSIVLRDLERSATQTVSIAFQAMSLQWKVSGEIQGAGKIGIVTDPDAPETYQLPPRFGGSIWTNEIRYHTVSNTFSISGSGDWYSTNLALIFIPLGESKGKIRGSFFFGEYW